MKRNNRCSTMMSNSTEEARGDKWLDEAVLIKEGKIRRKQLWIKGYRFNKYHFVKVQLYRGAGKFPRTEEMTLSSMRKANALFVKQYIKVTSGGCKSTLWEWKVADRESIHAERADKIYGVK